MATSTNAIHFAARMFLENCITKKGFLLVVRELAHASVTMRFRLLVGPDARRR